MKWMMLRSSANLMSRSTMTLWTPISRLRTWRKYELARHNTIWKNKGTISFTIDDTMYPSEKSTTVHQKMWYKFRYMCLIFKLKRQTKVEWVPYPVCSETLALSCESNVSEGVVSHQLVQHSTTVSLLLQQVRTHQASNVTWNILQKISTMPATCQCKQKYTYKKLHYFSLVYNTLPVLLWVGEGDCRWWSPRGSSPTSAKKKMKLLLGWFSDNFQVGAFTEVYCIP